VKVVSQVMLNNNSKEELEKVMEKVLEELRKYGVNYFYLDNRNELLIKGDVLALSDNYAFIAYDEDLWGWHYDVILERKPDSVILRVTNRESSPHIGKEIVIPVPAKKIYYAKPYLRIEFQS